MTAQRTSSAGRTVPALSPSATSVRPRSGSNSATSSSRSVATSARPFSSTNLSATVATSRFKTFAVQYEILCKNPILCELAKDVPWKNLLDLFTLKFYAVGDVLWRHGDHPMELMFVLCGGFLARHMRDEQNEPEDERQHGSRSNSYENTKRTEHAESIVAEKMLNPGASIAGYAVDHSAPIRYTVMTAKFKSILIALPIGKYRSVMRQLTPATKDAVQSLIVENETKLCLSLRLAPPKVARASTTQSASSPRRAGSPLKRSASTPTVITHRHAAVAVDPTVTALNKAIHTASWDSLQIAQPVEYEVNSSLLILHDSGLSKKQHMPSSGHSAGEQLRAKLLRGSSSSSVIRTIAKKHTTRRLQSIKLPATIEAFPPQPKQDRDIEAEALAHASFSGSHSLDVVPKIRIGRLLAPIKKPAMVENEADLRPHIRPRPTTMGGLPSKRVHEPPLVGRLILLADRDKKFREEI